MLALKLALAALLQSSPTVSLDFGALTIAPYNAQDVTGAATVLDSGATLRLSGNTWKRVEKPYNVTPGTVLQFDFQVSKLAEIHAIGLATDADISSTNESHSFQLAGTQTWGLQPFRNYAGPNWVSYSIPIGQYFTGPMRYVTFTNDHDVSSPTGQAAFRNVRLVETSSNGLLIQEDFEDSNLRQRGWYDGNNYVLATGAASGQKCLDYFFYTGSWTATYSSRLRHLFGGTETVYLRFYVKFSPSWKWTGPGWSGPHMMHFLTDADGPYTGPAVTHLTIYVEAHAGKLRIVAQDGANASMPHGTTQGPIIGGSNARFYDSAGTIFTTMNRWYCVEAMVKLNSLDLANDKPRADGELRGWVDGQLAIQQTGLIFRTTDFPNMKFNQFAVLPYFHGGVPNNQSFRIDKVAIGTKRIGP